MNRPIQKRHRVVMLALAGTLAAVGCGQRDIPTPEGSSAEGTAAQQPTGFEPAAIAELRAIVSAQITFALTCANNGYAQRFEDLVKPAPGSSMGYLAPGLTNGGVKRGYTFTLRPGDAATVVARAENTCNGSAEDAMSSFFAEAHPVTVGMFTRRSFATDERGMIFMREDGQPIAPGMDDARELK
jgi:hypothetical protein